jgi:hypothetical protein
MSDYEISCHLVASIFNPLRHNQKKNALRLRTSIFTEQDLLFFKQLTLQILFNKKRFGLEDFLQDLDLNSDMIF